MLGELAVVLGIAKSLFPEPQGHGLAVLECVGVCFVIWMLTYTQRQKETIETDLRRSEERLRALVQHASDVIMVLQADGVVSYTSPALLRLLGYSQLERIGVEILPDDEVGRANEFFADLMERPGEVAWIELPLRHIDGSFHWFEVGVTNRLDDPAVSRHGVQHARRERAPRRAGAAHVPGVPRRAHPACRTAGSSSSGSSRRCSTRRRTTGRSPCCSSTSTASSS